MENILGLDLNEIVSKQVSENISQLEQTIAEQYKTINELTFAKQQQSERLKAVENSESLLLHLRSAFNDIKPIKEDRDKNIYGKSLHDVRLEFIKNILTNIFNIPAEACVHGSFTVNLSIHYYDHKDLILSLLALFGVDEKILSQIRQYKLPKYWSKDDVLEFVKKPQYCTNGEMFGNSRYWAGGKENLPFNWIMVNPIITEEDVFDELIASIKQCRGEWKYLFAVHKYATLSKEQIVKLGDTLVIINPRGDYNDQIRDFIRSNIIHFSKEAKDHLFKYCSDDNQFNLFYWENFPVEYQQKYLMSKSATDILSILSKYSCKWTDEEKEEFLKKRFKGK